MIQAVHKRIYLIGKLEVFEVLSKSVNEMKKVGGGIYMPLCPLVKNR